MYCQEEDRDWLVSVFFVTTRGSREEGTVLRTEEGLGRRSWPEGEVKGEEEGGKGPAALPVAPSSDGWWPPHSQS